ncbi:rhomboid family intramembrane serine protease [Haloechinothrix sp. YIM 98757]|uniref:Rhomboid family intramembrane serine protease n=1 Tax=Haloechinothrix aidingensis TaxID=2752311 RepID=A0A837ZWZ7_9PSEU|nr:rhomboid family intramembrane serine protease [Haloechinothrix aidingensis]MBA0125156.1 rhomboid family intramembrane serine protease [Haloechinothrix aidingensis]
MSRLPEDSTKRALPAEPGKALLVSFGFVALLYLVWFVDRIFPASLVRAGGIRSRDWSEFDGLLWAPLLHGGWDHLAANTVPVVVFAFLAMAGGLAQWAVVTALIWMLSGLGVWLAGPSQAVTIGASGLAFGWLAFLLVRGFFNRSGGQLVIAGILFFLYGSMLWSVLPLYQGVSWQGHLFGALSGILAAWLVARAERGQVRATRWTW